MKIRSYGISGDSKLCTAIEQIVEKSDVSILDTSYIEKKDKPHMSLEEINILLDKNKFKKIIPIHMHEITKNKSLEIENERLIVLNSGDEFCL